MLGPPSSASGVFVRTALSPIEGLKHEVREAPQITIDVRTALSPIEGLKLMACRAA